MLRALLPSLSSLTLALETCAIEAETRIVFDFGSATVAIDVAGTQQRRLEVAPEVEQVDEYMTRSALRYLPCR